MFSQKYKRGWRNPWAIGMIAIVTFTVLANSGMIWNAMHVRVRMLDESFDVKVLKAAPSAQEQEVLRTVAGWHARLDSPRQLANDKDVSEAQFILRESPATFRFALNDGENKPLQGAHVDIKSQWPSNAAEDFSSELHEVKPGLYEGIVKFPHAGNWDLLIHAELGKANFDTEQRVFVLESH